MSLKLKIKKIDIEAAGKPVALLNFEDAMELGVHSTDRVSMTIYDKIINAMIDVTNDVVKQGEIGLFRELGKELKVREGEEVSIEPAHVPDSVYFIKKRLFGEYLTRPQVFHIISDIVNNKLSDVESVYFISSAYVKEFTDDETVALTEAMVDSGQVLEFSRHPVVDKHSIGGIPGNRATMILTPIVAAAGLLIPKTSSRAISSASGTADAMEVLAPVNLSLGELKRIVMKINACIVWGGSMNLVPADDILNQLRYPLRLDPKPFLLSSILAKKKSVGADKVIIDIPVGRGAKIETEAAARSLAYSFISLGAKMGMEVQCIITPGEKPIGAGVGPALEARDVLKVLYNDPGAPDDLRDKALSLAGIMLEAGGKAGRGEGFALAEKILTSGAALEKMRQIIDEQGGNAKITVKEVPVGNEVASIRAKQDGRIYGFDNSAITRLAREAGAPKDKGAGIDIKVTRGQCVRKDDVLIEIYSEHPAKLEKAIAFTEKEQPVIMEKSVLGIIGNFQSMVEGGEDYK